MPITPTLAPQCVACSGDETTPLPVAPNPLPGEPEYVWRRCNRCGSHSAFPRRAMDYEEAYKALSVYTTAMADLAGAVRTAKNCENGQWYNRCMAYRFVKRTAERARLLDVGAGTGFMLSLAEEMGIEPVGVDISEKCRRFVESNVRGAKMHATLEEVSGQFSHVVALEVLEHVEDPLAFLGQLKEKLREDGYLVLSVPNVERLNFRLHGEGKERETVWRVGGVGDTAPHHLTRFTSDGLRSLLERAGFGAVHVGFTPLDLTTALLHPLGTSPFFKLRLGGAVLGFPIRWLSKFFNEEIANKMFASDPTLGFGLVAVARPNATDVDALSSVCDEIVKEVVAENLTYHDKDLLNSLLEARGPVLRAILSRLLPHRSSSA